jgi:hypothetical protein
MCLPVRPHLRQAVQRYKHGLAHDLADVSPGLWMYNDARADVRGGTSLVSAVWGDKGAAN